MEKTLKSVSEISFIFFLAFGILHIASSILIAKGILERSDWIIFNSFDLPFLLSALVFGSSRLSLSLFNILGESKTPVVALSFISFCLFGFALYLNFLVPDAVLF
ncbi:MAG: hypothetical protein AAB802_02115 [Patescibacteria group bacterium]